MIRALTINWRVYLKEAWALGMFMLSACCFVILAEHPYFGMPTLIRQGFMRRMIIALAMAITAVLLIYSRWGKQTGAHMNPAVTLANYHLDRIGLYDTLWYIIAQFFGASLVLQMFKVFAHDFISNPSVFYLVTMPGKQGALAAFIAEFILSFILFFVVLTIGNSSMAKYTGYFAGTLVFLFISFEAPLSGMSINPARSFGSALAGNSWRNLWIYMVSPVAGMQLAAMIFRRCYLFVAGECKTMKVLMSGSNAGNQVYQVFAWYEYKGKGRYLKSKEF